MKNVSQRETHFDGERQNPRSFVVRIVRFTVFQRRGSDGGVAGRSVGSFCASLHAHGGTFDSVTCHQRRYHYLRVRIVALSRAIGCTQRGVVRSARISSHPGWSASWRTRCPAPRKQNVSACPIRFSEKASRGTSLYTTKTKKRSKKTKIRKRSQAATKRNRLRQISSRAYSRTLDSVRRHCICLLYLV